MEQLLKSDLRGIEIKQGARLLQGIYTLKSDLRGIEIDISKAIKLEIKDVKIRP